MTTSSIITIGREFGSGGRDIGLKLASDLGIKYYDKDLLTRAAKDSGLAAEIFESHDEKPTSSFLYSLVMDTYSMGYMGNTYAEMPINHKVFLAQFETIKKIASEGPCVIIGRCADYALESFPNVISIFIHADLEQRVKRVSQHMGIKESKARDLILKTDKQRASYYNYFTNKKWANADSYELSLCSSTLGIDGAARVIEQYVQTKEELLNGEINFFNQHEEE